MSEIGLYPNYDRDATSDEKDEFVEKRYNNIISMMSAPDDDDLRDTIKKSVVWYANQYQNEVIHEAETRDYPSEKMRKFVED